MVCSYCSTPNPETNRFCGECGQPLVRQQVTVPQEFGSLAERHSHREETTISGPSFLGLTNSDDEESNYLLEDEHPHHSHTGWVVFSVIALVLLGGVGWLEWNAIKTGQIELPWFKSAPAESASSSAQPAENVSATPATSESAANASEQKPETDNASDAGGTTTSSAPDAMLAAADTKKPDATPGTNNPDGGSDADATHAAQSRIATDAAHRRDQAESGNEPDNSSDSSNEPESEKPGQKAKSIKAEPKADPRQDRMLMAGEKYLYGRGVPQDCNQALVYFRAAAEKQNGPAMSHLGAMYASGHCVTQNKVAAYKWFSRASESEPSNQWISRSMNMLWRDMSPQERASVAR